MVEPLHLFLRCMPTLFLLSVALILSPYVKISFFSLCVFSSSVSGQHRLADLILASLISAATFKVAYQASQVLGTVLLQISPRRGLSNGKMEVFFRAMWEVYFHPVLFYFSHTIKPSRLNAILKLYISLLHISGNSPLVSLHLPLPLQHAMQYLIR